jgi:hypothetical protein
MTVLVRYQPTSLSREVYDRVNEALGRQGQQGPPPELRVHVLFGEDPNLRVSEVWESEDAWRRWYEAQLQKAFTDVGLEMPAPEVIAVQELWGSALQSA